MAPNAGGRLEDAEVARLHALAAELRRRYAAPVAVAEDGTDTLEIALAEPALVGRSEAMEDLQHGEHVLAWALEAQVGKTGAGEPAWHWLATGNALGHKRLDSFAPILARRFRLRAIRSRGAVQLRRLRLFGPA